MNSRRRNVAVEIWNNILHVQNRAYLYGRATTLAKSQSNIMLSANRLGVIVLSEFKFHILTFRALAG